ncbi:hypothetical protein A1O1_04638 [Capronia coronata CBS 617.96]|uniref:Cyclin N-terminal domain-containing protein n=1 Tax=Capronia coronata CBS 617.96 TaxID=1182541 RepID=W9Y5A8_9EURO|nr:uncharacterized protein A1O1_04638 [Capronia coronata CBS 617.96]EXJ87713.1 hypothetical protein A1O1_04638 [Capronia coronata CBS 617.96]
MPSYHSWGPNGQHSRLPPTPPEYQPDYLTPMSAVSEHGFYSSQGFGCRRSLSSREYNDRYHAPPAYSAQQPPLTGRVGRLGHLASREYPYSQSYGQPGAQYGYTTLGAPILPPIRAPEALDPYTTHYAPQHAEKKVKEDKPTGGVAQHLDYDMDLMANFVADMSQKLVTPESTPTSQFRKYVSQILSSTRLPSSTIMLGLFYLSSRMKQVNERGQSTSSSGTVYRMLTTCLLLGSKFLDDNTFQNRSWAEVSSIPVHELNMMELQWLTDFNWEIHGMMYDEDEGFFMWVEHWHAYEEQTQLAKVKDMQKLAPLDTNLRRSHSIQHQPLLSPEGPIPPQYQQGPQFDTRWVRPYISEYSPPSAPHSGPSTPDYYTPSWSYAPTGPAAYGRQGYHSGATSSYSAPRTQVPVYGQTYPYPTGLTAANWMPHGANCNSSLHAKQSDYYFNQTGYPVQTVAG